MQIVPSMVDMALDRKELEEIANPSPPRYPYGLCISLCEDELEKLGLLDDELEPGDYVHMHCMAKVTSTSKNSNQDGDHTRVELQIIAIAAEDEAEEDKKSSKKDVTSRLYR